MTDIKEIIKFARPGSAESSINTYARIYTKFTDYADTFDGEMDPDEWVQDTDWVDERIESLNLKPTTQRNYYVALMIFTEGFNGGKYSNKWEQLPEYLHYKSKADALNKAYNENVSKGGGITSGQKENMTELDEIIKMMESMTPTLRKIRSGLDWTSGPGAIARTDTDFYMAYVLISLYLELPLRNEVATLVYINQRDLNRIPQDMRTNYLVDSKKDGVSIIRYKYKTSAVHGPITIKLEKELGSLVRGWIKWRNIQKTEFVFPELQPSKDATVSTAELNLTKFLQRFFKSGIDKKISTTLLAKITTKNLIDKETLKKLAKAAMMRGTSLGVMGAIYAGGGS